MYLKDILDKKSAAYENQRLLSITHMLQGFHYVSDRNLTFSLKKCIYNCLVKLLNSIQSLLFGPSPLLSTFLESNGGLSLELSDEVLIF
jgi:hypothetical protein